MPNQENIKVTFAGGASAVTGANFLIQTNQNYMAVDCGMTQGWAGEEDPNHKPFSYNPAELDHVFVTHAHLDHIGRLAKLVKDGFNGNIYSTAPTKDLAELMLTDTLHIMTEEEKKHQKPKLFEEKDLIKTLSLWKVISYHDPLKINEDTTVKLYQAGHILGASMVKITYKNTSLLFSGDLGNEGSPLLPNPEVPDNVDYLFIESVYGNRNHEDKEDRLEILERSIEETINSGGTMLMPIFSLERTQDILYEINELVENNHIPKVKVFLDSPLAIKVTDIFSKYTEFLNKNAKSDIKGGDDIFNFPGLKLTPSVNESKAINEVTGPKIIMAGSGMSHGGRIKHHELRYLTDPNNSILFTGYQAVHTLGRKIIEGAKKVRIMGKDIRVRAKKHTIHGYSGHMDSQHLIEFIGNIKPPPKQVHCLMGEPQSSLFLSQRVRDYLDIPSFTHKEDTHITIPIKV